MITLESLQELLGWCTVINVGVLLFSTVMMALFRRSVARIHARIFGMSEAELSCAYFQYLARYKIAILVFNFVPYIALRIMA
ncbi:MAG: hypothetical protein IAE97_14255 [Chthoniobacterales bacterium]|nr:hypothetical protein [Chthoniobacterales bacterium]